MNIYIYIYIYSPVYRSRSIYITTSKPPHLYNNKMSTVYIPVYRNALQNTLITIENLPGRFYLFRTGRFSGAGWRYGQVFEKGGFDAKMT